LSEKIDKAAREALLLLGEQEGEAEDRTGPVATRALVPVQPQKLSLEEMKTYALTAFKSRVYKGLESAEEALIKIQVGQEAGLSPSVALILIDIIDGKPSFSANYVAGKIKQSSRYDYRVKELTNDRAVLVFFEWGGEVGTYAFTMEDAKQAELLIKNGKKQPSWHRFPRAMLFSRALTGGARIYCPDILGVGITPYLGSDKAVEDDILDAEWTEIKKKGN
jgi:hypothetical protein